MKTKIVSTRLKKYRFLPLNLINNFNKKQQKAFFKNLDAQQLKFFLECISNLQLRNIPISPQILDKLKKYKTTIKYLNNSKNQLRQKRVKFMKGGFASLLLSLLASALPLIYDTLKKK
jgi:Fic family protein